MSIKRHDKKMKNTKLIVRIICIVLTVALLAGMFLTTVAHAAEVDDQSIWANTNNVPLFSQTDYGHVPYGAHGTVKSHGCGITCIAMVATYFLGDGYTPDVIAYRYGGFNGGHGTSWSLFKLSAEDLGIPFQEMTTDWEVAKSALANDQLVVCVQDVGLFTGGSHYILLTGLTDDGRVMVNDPYGYNYYENEELTYGFMNGFTDEQITASGCAYWIYGKKDVEEQPFYSPMRPPIRLIECGSCRDFCFNKVQAALHAIQI